MRVGSAQIHLTAVAIPCLLLSVLWSCAARQTSGTQRRPTQGDSEDGFQVCGVYLCGPFGMGSWQTLILYQDGNFRLIEAPHSCLGGVVRRIAGARRVPVQFRLRRPEN